MLKNENAQVFWIAPETYHISRKTSAVGHRPPQKVRQTDRSSAIRIRKTMDGYPLTYHYILKWVVFKQELLSL